MAHRRGCGQCYRSGSCCTSFHDLAWRFGCNRCSTSGTRRRRWTCWRIKSGTLCGDDLAWLSTTGWACDGLVIVGDDYLLLLDVLAVREEAVWTSTRPTEGTGRAVEEAEGCKHDRNSCEGPRPLASRLLPLPRPCPPKQAAKAEAVLAPSPSSNYPLSYFSPQYHSHSPGPTQATISQAPSCPRRTPLPHQFTHRCSLNFTETGRSALPLPSMAPATLPPLPPPFVLPLVVQSGRLASLRRGVSGMT